MRTVALGLLVLAAVGVAGCGSGSTKTVVVTTASTPATHTQAAATTTAMTPGQAAGGAAGGAVPPASGTSTPASTPRTTTPATTSRPAATTSTPAATTPRSNPSGPLPILITSNWSGVRPGEIDFSADGGNIVIGISWSSWTSAGAVGHGASDIQSCVPNCATGKTTVVPTTIALSNPQGGHFTTLVESRNGQSATDNYSSQQSWPIGAR